MKARSVSTKASVNESECQWKWVNEWVSEGVRGEWLSEREVSELVSEWVSEWGERGERREGGDRWSDAREIDAGSDLKKWMKMESFSSGVSFTFWSHFTSPHSIYRYLLAALHFNENVNQEQKVDADGDP